MTQQIRKGRKFDQVLQGARDVFLKDGFEGASVDDIARAAGVSKATLYSYFPDKRLLFAEVARCESLRQADSSLEVTKCCDTPEEVLRDAARRISGFLTSKLGQAILRMTAAESARFPELGRMFYRSGPGLVRDRLVEFLEEAVSAGQLQIDDIPFAADQFAELCKASYFPKILCGKGDEITQADLDRTVEGAVRMFMERYGV